jgi:hypothetical protein
VDLLGEELMMGVADQQEHGKEGNHAEQQNLPSESPAGQKNEGQKRSITPVRKSH